MRVRDASAVDTAGVGPSSSSAAASQFFPEKKSEISGGIALKDRRGRIERWEEEREGAADEIFVRVCDGETLKAVCKSRGWPYSMVAKWVAETPEVFRAYEQALRFHADALAQETTGIADAADPTEVGKAKLQTEVRMKLASRLDRARYGDKVEVSGAVKHTHSLIGILSGMTVDAEVLPAPQEKPEKSAISVTINTGPAVADHELI